jgi:hypothetical protein
MRLDGHSIAEKRVGQHTAAANRATRPDLSFSEKLHARLNHRVFARCDLRIDQHRFGQLNGDSRVHQFRALPFAKYAVHFRQVRARVAAQNFAGVWGDFCQNGLVFRGHGGDGIRQVKLAMLVVGLDVSQCRPELVQREAIDRGVDFV